VPFEFDALIQIIRNQWLSPVRAQWQLRNPSDRYWDVGSSLSFLCLDARAWSQDYAGMPQGERPSALLVDGCSENAQVICSADLSNLIWSETKHQHRIDNHVVEPGGLILLCQIGALSNLRVLLLRTKTRRRTTWTGMGSVIFRWRARRARTRLGELGICADAHMISADHVDLSTDVVGIF
jgi:hypothetical protein